MDVERPFKYIRDEYNFFIFFFQAEDGIRDSSVTGVQTCALPISGHRGEMVRLGGGAAATGFVPGAYMFLEQGNATAQANHFAAVAGDLDGFALFADIEPTGSSHPTLDRKSVV